MDHVFKILHRLRPVIGELLPPLKQRAVNAVPGVQALLHPCGLVIELESRGRVGDTHVIKGVLLVNLGTPDAPTTGAVRRYLKEFLSDPRVVEIPKLVWWPILNGFILNTRPSKSAHAYAQVWTEDGSPLAAITKAQAAALQDRRGA